MYKFARPAAGEKTAIDTGWYLSATSLRFEPYTRLSKFENSNSEKSARFFYSERTGFSHDFSKQRTGLVLLKNEGELLGETVNYKLFSASGFSTAGIGTIGAKNITIHAGRASCLSLFQAKTTACGFE